MSAYPPVSSSETSHDVLSDGETNKYAISVVEKKWQNYWYQNQVFSANAHSPRPPFYVLEMFPYPSGTLHMGHARNYAIGDALARYRWAQGFEVLHPMGWDACGLPAENAALNHGVNPKEWTYRNASVMKEQCLSLGFSHDWSREFFSCDPTYFRHEQKIFLDFYAHGLAYRKESYVNWDPKEQSVLANEQVVDGKGWRSGAVVEKRLLNQWFLKITDFAEELLEGLKGLTQWPEAVREMQTHWIGQSHGLTVTFKGVIDESVHHDPLSLDIFTTRPETLFGATFCAVAWDHPWVSYTLSEHRSNVDLLVKDCRQKGTSSRVMETVEQKGAWTGLWVHHPLILGKTLPVVVANYVSSDYGTGAIFGCPGHDGRDYALAIDLDLPIAWVIEPEGADCALLAEPQGPYIGDGIMKNSGFLNGLSLSDARSAMVDHCEKAGLGAGKTLYRLRDWGVGRQRYWGVPIPMIHCQSCGVVPVPDVDLPIVLPENVRFDQPGNPLQNHPTWKNVRCPSCGQDAQRETDTFDTFMESSWYFARFCDPHNGDKAFSGDQAEHWLPVHQYVGGIEHAVMHLLYARFFTKALKKCGYWTLSEPFQGLFTQGMVCHKTYQSQDGTWLLPEEVDDQGRRRCDGSVVRIGRSEKMSKSKCNVVGVTDVVQTYGADAVRLFVLSDTPPQKDLEWSEEGIEGAWRYVRRLWSLFQKYQGAYAQISDDRGDVPSITSDHALGLHRSTHRFIQNLQHTMEGYGLNKYVALLREWSNLLGRVILSQDQDSGHHGSAKQEDAIILTTALSDRWVLRQSWISFIQATAPIMPHLAEEMASVLGLSPGIHLKPWITVDETLLQEECKVIGVQINGKHRGSLSMSATATEQELLDAVKHNASFSKYTQGVWKRTIVVPGRMISIIVE